MEEVLASDAVKASPAPAAPEMPAALRLRTVAVRADCCGGALKPRRDFLSVRRSGCNAPQGRQSFRRDSRKIFHHFRLVRSVGVGGMSRIRVFAGISGGGNRG